MQALEAPGRANWQTLWAALCPSGGGADSRRSAYYSPLLEVLQCGTQEELSLSSLPITNQTGELHVVARDTWQAAESACTRPQEWAVCDGPDLCSAWCLLKSQSSQLTSSVQLCTRSGSWCSHHLPASRVQVGSSRCQAGMLG